MHPANPTLKIEQTECFDFRGLDAVGRTMTAKFCACLIRPASGLAHDQRPERQPLRSSEPWRFTVAKALLEGSTWASRLYPALQQSFRLIRWQLDGGL
jgi:hypothetical protein